MKIGPWGKTGFLIDHFNKNTMQLHFQMSRLTLTIQLKNNCSRVISKVLEVTLVFHCAQLRRTITRLALINRVRLCGETGAMETVFGKSQSHIKSGIEL